MPGSEQRRVYCGLQCCMRIAKLEHIPAGVIQELDKVLQRELRATGALETDQVGGVKAVAEILNNVDQASEREIMIAGLEQITAGEIAIAGRRVNEVEPKDRNIAMVFQNYALYPHMLNTLPAPSPDAARAQIVAGKTASR